MDVAIHDGKVVITLEPGDAENLRVIVREFVLGLIDEHPVLLVFADILQTGLEHAIQGLCGAPIFKPLRPVRRKR